MEREREREKVGELWGINREYNGEYGCIWYDKDL